MITSITGIDINYLLTMCLTVISTMLHVTALPNSPGWSGGPGWRHRRRPVDLH